MKKITALLLLIITILFIMIPSYAHSGRTDSNGGHRDSSTGKYHYHHGYSAHQHYDIDGDGTIDCPYKYKDKTNHNSNSSTNHASNDEEKAKIKTNSFKDTIINALIISAILIITSIGFIFHAMLSSILLWIIENIFSKETNSKIVNAVNVISWVIIIILVIVVSIYAKIIS